MTLATVFARAQNGLTADLVTVEVHLAPGLPGLNIVGLPEASVREAKDRVRAAISHSGRSEQHPSELQSLMRISYADIVLNNNNSILTYPHSIRLTHINT